MSKFKVQSDRSSNAKETSIKEVQCFASLSVLQRSIFAKLHGFSTCALPKLPNGTSAMQPSKVHTTAGDGNCFFRAVIYMLTGSEEQHSILRNHVVEHIKINKLDDYLMKNGKTYLEESSMTNNGVWATDAELLPCATFIGYNIIVYAKMGAFSE